MYALLSHLFIVAGFIFWISLSVSLAQQNRTLQFIASEEDKKVLEKHSQNLKNKDSLAILQVLSGIKLDLHRDGYLTASFDSIYFTPEEIRVEAWLGKAFEWAELSIKPENEAIFNRIGYRQKFYLNQPFRHEEVARIMEKALIYSQNNGFPFASIGLSEVSVEGDRVKAHLNYTAGPPITFDTLQLTGDSHFKTRFLSVFLGIIPGQPYDESKVEASFYKLKSLQYLQIEEPPYVSFQNNQAIVYFNVNGRKANQVDGIIGFLPNEAGDNKLLLTGEFNLQLQNLFGTGKKLDVQWQKLKALSQFLDIDYHHPNLIRTPFGLEVGFDLLKEDTTFLNRNFRLAFSYRTGRYGNLHFFGRFKTANLLSTSQYTDAMSLPGLADFNLSEYGAEYAWMNLDDVLQPTAGISFQVEAGAGNKKIRKNSGLDEKLYEDITLQNLQVSANFSTSMFSRLGRKNVLLSKLLAAYTSSEQLFLNDLYRVGGLQSLRGFNENFFFASQFAVATLEKRFLLDANSYLLVFYDQGYVHHDVAGHTNTDFPRGIGTGINFSTEGGAFTFIFALGNNEDQPFSINYSKIHFGYISRF